MKTNLKRNLSIAKLKLRKHSPEIMVVAGCVGAVTAGIMACKETLKLTETVNDSKELINDIKNSEAAYPTEKEFKKDLTVAYAKSVGSLVKLYAPSVLLGSASISLIFASNNIIKRRNASLAAAYATLDSMFKKYRANVVETFGEDIDRDMRYGIKHEIVEVEETDDKGKTKKVKKKIDVVSGLDGYSDFARFFDSTSKYYEDSDIDNNYNLLFLKGVQSWCTNKLTSEGYLFLSDVYKALGLPDCIAAHSVGWVYDENNPIGDNYVDFGIYDVHNEANRAFVNGTESVILLDFNIDGDILHDERLRMYLK